MKTKELIEMVKMGCRPIMVFNSEINHIEFADPGMMARITGFGEIDDWGEGTSTIEVFVNLSEFEEYNKSFALTSWSSGDGSFDKTWFETEFYPKDGKDTLHFMLKEKDQDSNLSYGDLVEENEYFKEFLVVKEGNKSYIQYLEEQLKKYKTNEIK